MIIDSSFLPKSRTTESGWGIDQSQKRFAAYCYASLRLLELQCGWLPIVSDSSFKIILGQTIGYGAERLALMLKRLGELFVRPVPLARSIEYVQQFSTAANLSSEMEIASFICATTDDIIEDMQAYLRNGDSLADEPSFKILHSCIEQLTQEVLLFKTYVGAGSNIVISRIDKEVVNQTVPYTSTEGIPPFVSIPKRPIGITLTDKNPHTHPTEESIIGFLHFVYLDIEIPAMEVCAMNINQYREMPFEFKLDMARQIWDEARHARLIKLRMEELGGKEGEYPIDLQVWKKYLQGSTLVERLATQQVVQEGNSVEANIVLADTMRKLGDLKTATVFDFLNADESIHARIGNKWLLYLCNHDINQYETVVREAAKRIEWTLPGKAPVNTVARELSGFPQAFIEKLLPI